jgi:membrane protein
VGVVVDRQQAAAQLSSQIEAMMGSAGGDLVNTILQTTTLHGGIVATIVSVVTLIISATAVFGELQATLNLIWEVQPAPTGGVWQSLWALLKQRLFSLALVLALAFLLLVSLLISAAFAAAATFFHGSDQTFLVRTLEVAVSGLVLVLVFALLFKYVPDAQIRWRDVWLGGLVSAVLFSLGKTAIGYYIGQSSIGSPYGAAGSLMVLLVWVYYSALIFFFGAEFTQVWATRHHEVVPKPHADPGVAPQHKNEVEAYADSAAEQNLEQIQGA